MLQMQNLILEEYYSQDYVRRKILRQTDEEIT